MTHLILVISGAVISIVWGIAHIVPTKNVVNGFGKLSRDNKLIITMEWIAEGLTLIFVGALTLVVALLIGVDNPVSRIVFLSVAIMLLAMATLTLFTGARSSIVPIKICPAVKTIASMLILIGGVV